MGLDYGKVNEKMRDQFRSWELMREYFDIRFPWAQAQLHFNPPPTLEELIKRCNQKYEEEKRRWAREN